MGETLDAPLRAARDYYSEKVRRHGATPLGVDWSCAPTQELRFIQLMKLCDFSKPLSINDLGCGYGALYGFLVRRRKSVGLDYLGIDISEEMIAAATRKWAHRPQAKFKLATHAYRVADYTLASGVFNVKLGCPRDDWEKAVRAAVEIMSTRSRSGFAVNFLRRLDELDDIPELYRCDPEPWIRFCESLGTSVEVLDCYGMPEFTLLARR